MTMGAILMRTETIGSDEYITTAFETDKCKIKVNKPLLTEEERKLREDVLVKALINFYKERKRDKNDNKNQDEDSRRVARRA
jgi:hypothetical protein